MFLYYIPFLITIFIPYQIPEIVITFISLTVLSFFFSVELIQMKYAGWYYIVENIWNFIEVT